MKERQFVAMMVLMGLGGAVLLHTFDSAPFIIAVFLGTGIASLTYGFLGGVQEARFELGPLKTGGSLAALVSVAWLANYHLERQTRVDLHRDFKPSADSWFATDKITSLPIEVTVPRARASITPPDSDAFLARALGLQIRKNVVRAVAADQPDFVVGSFQQEGLKEAGFFNALDQHVRDVVVTDELFPMNSVNLDPLPLTLSSRRYSGEYSRYVLIDGEGREVFEGAIYRRGAQIAQVNGRRFIVMVVAVDHQRTRPFAKFAVGEIVPAVVTGG